MGEYLDFINNLEPVWEDPHEFDWLRSENKITKEDHAKNVVNRIRIRFH